MNNEWETKTLGEIAEIKGGKRVPKGYRLQVEPTKHPYITIADFNDNGSISTSTLRYISEEVFEQIKRYTISSRDLYLSIAGTIGKTGYVPPDLDGANLTENACKLVLRDDVDRDFVYYFTKSDDFIRQAGINTRTAAQPKLALERLKTICLRIPKSVAEQRRIVAILDEAFEAIDKAIQNTEKNLQNARELFESYLQNIFTNPGDNWEESTLGETYDVRDGTHHSPKYHDTGFPLVTSKNLKRNGLSLEKVNLISKEDYDEVNRRSRVDVGDVLLAMIGTIGNPVLITDQPNFAIKNVALFKVPEDEKGAFLKYYLESGVARSKMLNEANGSTQKFVSLKYLRSFPIRIPNKQTQNAIVEQIDRMKAQSDRLEQIYSDKIDKMDELRKSALQRAFEGDLGGNSYEHFVSQ